MSKTLQHYLDKIPAVFEAEDAEARKNGRPDKSKWHKRVISECNTKLSEEVRQRPMDEFTPEEIVSILTPFVVLGDHHSHPIYRGLRICFMMAAEAHDISVNPMIHVHIGRVQRMGSKLPEESLETVFEQCRIQPGGIMYGMSGFLDISIRKCARIKYEFCDKNTHTIIIPAGPNTSKSVTMYDPEEIEFFNTAIEKYEGSMADPVFAANNFEHYLFTSRSGMPYTNEQCSIIGNNMRDAVRIPEFGHWSFRLCLRLRQL